MVVGLYQEDCQLKDYIVLYSLKDVQDSFRRRTHLEGIKGNIRWKNQGCDQYEDTQTHVMVCKAYEALGDSITKNEYIVEYFR